MCLAVIVVMINIRSGRRGGRNAVTHRQLCIISISLLIIHINIISIVLAEPEPLGLTGAILSSVIASAVMLLVRANSVDSCSCSTDSPATTAVPVKKLDSFGSFEINSYLWSLLLFL